jgi:hypothetical protein
LGFGGFVFANDLKIPDLSLIELLLESDFLRVLEPAVGCGVERPEVFASDALPRLSGTDLSFSLLVAAALSFAATLSAGFVAGAEGGANFVVLL